MSAKFPRGGGCKPILSHPSISTTVVLKELDNKVEGSSPSKTTFFFFFFFFLLSQICREFLEIYMFAEKSMFWCIMHMLSDFTK